MRKFSKFADPMVIGWLCVLSAALAMSDYSLFIVARHFGTPIIFAVLGGVIFDGAAIVFATISFNSVKSGYPGSGAKLGTILCALLSAYINSYHQTLLNQPVIAKLFWSAPPIIAVSVFEAHIRYVKRRTLVNQGRIAPDLPTFGKWAWILFPVKTLRIARNVVQFRLGIVLARNTPGIDRDNAPVPVTGAMEITAGSGVSGQTFGNSFRTLPDGSPTFGELGETFPGSMRHARDWARANGYTVNDRGPLSANVLRDYMHAINSVKAGNETSEITDNTEPAEIEIPDRQVNE
jgi:hypothetical protein